jgi:hypothetical protein
MRQQLFSECPSNSSHRFKKPPLTSMPVSDSSNQARVVAAKMPKNGLAGVNAIRLKPKTDLS